MTGGELGLALALAAGGGVLELPTPGPWVKWEVSAYSHGCVMPRDGVEKEEKALTASGKEAVANWTVAAPPHIPFGTVIEISHRGIITRRIVQDRGRAIQGRRLDLFMRDCSSARSWGRREVWARVLRVPLGGTKGKQGSNAKKARKTSDTSRRVSGSRSR